MTSDEPIAGQWDDLPGDVQSGQPLTVGEQLAKQARSSGSAPAIETVDGTTTFEELHRRTDRLGAALLARGYEPGDVLAVVAENRTEYVDLIYTAAKTGLRLATLNWRLAPDELRHCLRLVRADGVFVSSTHDETIDWIRESDLDPEILLLDETGADHVTYDGLLAADEDSAPVAAIEPSPEDILAVLNTSGTTGRPKGVAISHRAFVARAQVLTALGAMTVEKPDFVAWPPMFHIASVDKLLAAGTLGGTVYVVDGPAIDAILDCAEAGEVGWLSMMPSMLDDFVEALAARESDASDLDLRYVGSQPDLIAPDKIAAVSAAFEARFMNTFGATETGLPPATGDSFHPGSVPASHMAKVESPHCDVKLVDEDWNRVPTGEKGEIAVRGPTLCSGYVGNREANESDFQDGWFRTGDVFVRHEDGRLEFVDRRKYLIKSGGENIYPAEIEKAILEHPDVSEAVAVRVPDEKWGEVPKLYVAGPSGATLTPTDVLQFLDGSIARYKFPQYVEIVEQGSFPRSTSGNVERAAVEAWPIEDEHRVREP